MRGIVRKRIGICGKFVAAGLVVVAGLVLGQDRVVAECKKDGMGRCLIESDVSCSATCAPCGNSTTVHTIVKCVSGASGKNVCTNNGMADCKTIYACGELGTCSQQSSLNACHIVVGSDETSQVMTKTPYGDSCP